jgi:hypothetical protein
MVDPARMVWSLATVRRYLRQQMRAAAARPGAGRQAGVGSSQVAVVDAGIAPARQLHDLIAHAIGQAARAGAATVGVDQPRRPVALEPNCEPPHLALAQLQQRRRLSDGDLADQQLRHDPGPSLFLAAHGDRLLHRWRLTNSLSS